MRRRLTALLGLAGGTAVLMLWLVAAPIVSAGDPCYHGFDMPTTTTSTDAQVKLMPCAFAPTVTNVPVGATVTFVNGPDFTHLITGANQAWGSRDVELAPGKTAEYRFDQAGVYPYACALHRGMSGVIVVGDATTALTGGAAAGTSGTTGSTTGSTGTTSTSDAAPAAAAGSPVETGALVVLSLAIGAILGGSIAWFAAHRRSRGSEEHATGMV